MFSIALSPRVALKHQTFSLPGTSENLPFTFLSLPSTALLPLYPVPCTPWQCWGAALPKQTLHSLFVVYGHTVAGAKMPCSPLSTLFLPSDYTVTFHYAKSLAGRLCWPPTGRHLLLSPFVGFHERGPAFRGAIQMKIWKTMEHLVNPFIQKITKFKN